MSVNSHKKITSGYTKARQNIHVPRHFFQEAFFVSFCFGFVFVFFFFSDSTVPYIKF